MTEKVASQRPQGPDKKRSFVERRQEMQNRFTVALKKARVMYRIFRLESYQFSRKVDDRLDPIADKVRYGAVRAAEAGRDAAKAGVEKAGRGVRELGRAALGLFYRMRREINTSKEIRSFDKDLKRRNTARRRAVEEELRDRFGFRNNNDHQPASEADDSQVTESDQPATTTLEIVSTMTAANLIIEEQENKVA